VRNILKHIMVGCLSKKGFKIIMPTSVQILFHAGKFI